MDALVQAPPTIQKRKSTTLDKVDLHAAMIDNLDLNGSSNMLSTLRTASHASHGPAENATRNTFAHRSGLTHVPSLRSLGHLTIGANRISQSQRRSVHGMFDSDQQGQLASSAIGVSMSMDANLRSSSLGLAMSTLHEGASGAEYGNMAQLNRTASFHSPNHRSFHQSGLHDLDHNDDNDSDSDNDDRASDTLKSTDSFHNMAWRANVADVKRLEQNLFYAGALQESRPEDVDLTPKLCSTHLDKIVKQFKEGKEHSGTMKGYVVKKTCQDYVRILVYGHVKTNLRVSQRCHFCRSDETGAAADRR